MASSSDPRELTVEAVKAFEVEPGSEIIIPEFVGTLASNMDGDAAQQESGTRYLALEGGEGAEVDRCQVVYVLARASSPAPNDLFGRASDLLTEIKTIVDEPLDEVHSRGRTRAGQFACIEALVRDLPTLPAPVGVDKDACAVAVRDRILQWIRESKERVLGGDLDDLVGVFEFAEDETGDGEPIILGRERGDGGAWTAGASIPDTMRRLANKIESDAGLVSPAPTTRQRG